MGLAVIRQVSIPLSDAHCKALFTSLDFPEEDIPQDILTRYEIKKYYKPLRGFPISTALYDKIQCFALTEGINYV